MKSYSIKELEENYKIDFYNVLNKIKKEKAKRVLLQFADGLKPYSLAIVDYLKEKTSNKVEFLIWLDSCYGACDTPVLSKEVENKIDLMFQFGHSLLQPNY